MKQEVTESTRSIESKEVKADSFKKMLAQHGESIAAVTCGVLTFAAWTGEGLLPHAAVVFFYILAYASGGVVKAKEGILTLVRERELDVNLLMLLAAIGAASIGYWFEGAILIFIFALSGALESYTMARSYRDIASLMELAPEEATRLVGGVEQVVRVEELRAGDMIIVKPGERIPADGVIREGATAVNEASITGESVPVEKTVGDGVYAGTLNGQGALFVEVSSESASTLFARIIQMVQEAQSEVPPTQRFIERFENVYAKSVLAICIVLIIVPPYMLGWSWSDALYRAMVFLVVASPCALVASIMPAMLSAISNGARKGVLFKGGAHLENLAGIRAIAFDKTGTLTWGRPEVTDMVIWQPYSEAELLRYAASVESLSEHPLAQAVLNRARRDGITWERPRSTQAVTGFGIAAECGGQTWRIGKLVFCGGELTAVQRAEVDRLEQAGKTVLFIANEQGIAGIIAVRDTLRPQAKQLVAALKELGIHVVMLTGDRAVTAQAIAAEAGVDEVRAELLPEQKVACIRELRERFGQVAMVGDGVNDAPALASATCGIAMGAGSDVALDTADLVLMNDDLEKIPLAIRLGRRAGKIVKQNIAFSLTVILLLIASNFAQSLTLPLGVIGHEGSTILVILNGLRLLRAS